MKLLYEIVCRFPRDCFGAWITVVLAKPGDGQTIIDLTPMARVFNEVEAVGIACMDGEAFLVGVTETNTVVGHGFFPISKRSGML